jgi:anti-anti-sigma factor
MTIDTRKESSVLVVSFRGKLDASASIEAEKKVMGLISGGETKVLLDLSGMDYISSAGLRVLLAVAKKMKAGKGAAAVSGVKGAVDEVFRISGFKSIFRMFPTQEEALRQGF